MGLIAGFAHGQEDDVKAVFDAAGHLDFIIFARELEDAFIGDGLSRFFAAGGGEHEAEVGFGRIGDGGHFDFGIVYDLECAGPFAFIIVIAAGLAAADFSCAAALGFPGVVEAGGCCDLVCAVEFMRHGFEFSTGVFILKLFGVRFWPSPV